MAVTREVHSLGPRESADVGMKRRARREADDARLLTLHLLLQTLKGSRLTVERHDGSSVEGTLANADDNMKCALNN